MSETPTEATTGRMTTKGMTWLGGVIAVLGLWIAASSFVFAGMSQASFWNNIIIGAAVFLIGGYSTYHLMNEMSVSMASMSFLMLLSLWMIAAPFVLGVTLVALFWSDLIAGALVAGLVGYNTYTERKSQQEAATEM